jgi:hypothetical protein
MLYFAGFIILSLANFLYYCLYAWFERMCCFDFQFGYFSFTLLCAVNAAFYLASVLAYYSYAQIHMNQNVNLVVWLVVIVIAVSLVRFVFGLCKGINQTLSLCSGPFFFTCAITVSVFVTFSGQAVFTGCHGNDDKCEHPYPHFDNDPTTCFVFYDPLYTSVILAVLLVLQFIMYCVLICSGRFRRVKGGGWKRIENGKRYEIQ